MIPAVVDGKNTKKKLQKTSSQNQREGNYQSSWGKMHLNARNKNYTIKGFAVWLIHGAMRVTCKDMCFTVL